MNTAKKLLAIALSALLSLSCLAGCGREDNSQQNPSDTDNTDTPSTPDTPEEPEVPDKSAPAYTDNGATVSLSGKVRKNSAEFSVSEDLFGLFLEDINYASQALDDNLIVNGNFESSQTVTKFDHKYGWTAGGGLDFATETGEKKLHTYAKISTPAGGTLTNAGYAAVPMSIRKGKDYLFSAFLRGYQGEITVKAKTSTATCAEKTFSVTAPDDEWVKVQQTITASGNESKDIVLEISFAAADTEVLLDAVQFETTDSTVGIKNYMYKAISNLSPAFFRFPGGCVIEGRDMYSAYDWKNSIGAVKEGDDDVLPAFTYTLYKDGAESQVTTYGEWATRVPNNNIWQLQDGKSNIYYAHEYGIGFYEYFLLCDSLGAKAIPIVNCGLSCQTQSSGSALAGRHNNKVDDYIQDAIDLIEFAKGGTDTEWGKIRANMGHPEPFEMDYIGIGNEQWDLNTQSRYFEDYYEKFLQNDAFQAALKQYNVKTIVGNCTLFQHCENPETHSKGVAQNAAAVAKSRGIVDKISEYGVVDQHYYVNYTDFLLYTHLYDNYLRPAVDEDNSYEVFVGEYAVNSQTVRAPSANDNVTYRHTDNSMITALAEAAMMTGFERNADIVKLAAYAPMFAPIAERNRNWFVDMMYFDNQSVVYTPNYYVQQLFMQNTGDYKVTADIQYADGVTAPKTTYKSTGTQTRECDDIFYVADLDKETGDVILKLVNAGATTLKVNVDFSVADLTLKGIADVRELAASASTDVNTADTEKVRPKKYTIGIEGNTFGYELLPYSVVAIRIRTK